MRISKILPFEIKTIDEIKVFDSAILISCTEKILHLDRHLGISKVILPGCESMILQNNLFTALGKFLYRDGEKVFETADYINEIQINCHKNLIGMTDDSGCVSVYKIKTEQTLVSKTKHENIAVPLAFRPTLGKQLCSGGFDSCIILWDADRLTEKLRIPFSPRLAQAGCNPPHVHSICWSADGSTLYVGLGSGDLAMMKIPRILKSLRRENVPVQYYAGHGWSICSIVCLNNSIIITGSIDKCIMLWRDGVVISKLNVGVKVNTMALYSDTELLIGSTDNKLRLVDFSEDL